MTEDPSRRTFLAYATTALGACTAAGAFTPAIAAILSPANGGIVKLGEGLLDLGPLDGFEDGVPKKVAVIAARTDAWLKEEARALGSVIVVRHGEKVWVCSTTCPHAGCDVSPSQDGAGMVCPCHESHFEKNGVVTTGPSPRPLDQLDAQVTGGRVLVRFERFQVGIQEKRTV
jgi:Rieske Fe-S protein